MTLLVVEQEIPVDGDLRAPLGAPAETEETPARLLAAGLGFAAVDVPHAEGNLACGVHDDLVLFGRAAVPLVLFVIWIGIADVDVRVRLVGARKTGDDRRASRLREVRVAQDPVREARGEARTPTVGGAVDMALEVGRQPDRDVCRSRRVHLEVELGRPRGREVAALHTGSAGAVSVCVNVVRGRNMEI